MVAWQHSDRPAGSAVASLSARLWNVDEVGEVELVEMVVEQEVQMKLLELVVVSAAVQVQGLQRAY